MLGHTAVGLSAARWTGDPQQHTEPTDEKQQDAPADQQFHGVGPLWWSARSAASRVGPSRGTSGTGGTSEHTHAPVKTW